MNSGQKLSDAVGSSLGLGTGLRIAPTSGKVQGPSRDIAPEGVREKELAVNKRLNRPMVLPAIAGSVVAALASGVQAQSSWSAVVNDSWFNPARWTPAGVPNSAATNVTLGLAGAYTVTMQNATATCGNLTISNASGQLFLIDNANLQVAGSTISNSGLITISDPASPGNLTYLSTAAPAVALSGTGTLRLAATTSNGDSTAAYLYYSAAGNILTQAAGHSLKGYGRVYTNLVNNGTVNADIATKGLFLIEQPKTNNATMTATNGGFLQIRSTSLTQGAGGVCLSSNSSPVQLVNASVSGGTLNGAGTSSGIQYFGSNTLDGVTLTNLNAVTDNSLVDVTAGGVTNNGTWTVSDPAAAGNLTRIRVAAPAATIGGSGTIRLQATTGNGDSAAAYLDYAAAANVLTNGPSHSIKGYGRIYANLVNNGTINADIANKGLFFIDQPKTNNGTMTASNGGFLQFRSITVTGNPAAQIISTDAASPVQMVSATMSGGGFTTSGTGIFQYFGTDYLSNLTVNGTHQIIDNSNVRLSTNLVNNGNWLINTLAGAGNLTYMATNAAAVAISGTGTIRMQATTSNGDSNAAYLTYASAGDVLTLGANQQLLGYGRVYTNLVNNGTINADITGKGLFFIDQPKTNNGTMTASNGGFLQFRSITVTGNPAAQIISTDAASPVQIVNATMSGGGFTTSSTGVFQYTGTDFLSNLTVNGTHQIIDNSNVRLSTNLVNNGNWLINTPAGAGNLTYMATNAAAVGISGTGTIRMQATSSNGDTDAAYLYYGAAGQVLTLGANQQLLGYGRVYTNVVNNGTINADIASKGLFFLDQPKTNNAVIRSTNGGFIYVRNTTISQGASGVMSTVGASGFGLQGATIVGGTVTTTAAGPLGTVSTSGLDGVTVSTGSVVQVNDNSTLISGAGGIINNGTIFVQSIGGAGNLTKILATGATTISGTGTVKLQATGFNNDTAYIQATNGASTPLTLGAGQTLSGTGRLYYDIVVNGAISPDQPFGTPTALGSIQPRDGTLKFGATSNFNCQLGAVGSYDSIQGNSAITITPGATLTVSLSGPFDPPVGSTYDIVTGSSVTGTFTNVNFPALLNKKQAFLVYGPNYVRLFVTCYANCDQSTGSPALTANDFQCFLNKYSANDAYANCDGSTANPILTANDFQCFLNRYSQGCN